MATAKARCAQVRCVAALLRRCGAAGVYGRCWRMPAFVPATSVRLHGERRRGRQAGAYVAFTRALRVRQQRRRVLQKPRACAKSAMAAMSLLRCYTRACLPNVLRHGWQRCLAIG
ncbi:hypothetical protein NPIL_427141 [Nephila pilipes]|uniref:Uncharacterized protein n=1 Tax=Nephila pilipes TaxID=299642 RepID=A0A8X6UI19_NEPPI|nr:hypothetical protein NPIL_427141 [Nephila pilipes]